MHRSHLSPALSVLLALGAFASAAEPDTAAQKTHMDAVIAVLDQAGGSYEKQAESLKTVNLASTALGVKGKREVDPFDHAFYEHLGHLTDLQSLTILNTTASNEDLVHVAKLKNLKSLNIINQAKLNDEGLAHLAGLNQLERLGYIGTSMMGHPFKDFNGWTKLKSASFRGSKLDDEGLQHICTKFPQLESLVLAHADFTDNATLHLCMLKGLKSFEIGTHKATPECLHNITALPIEYLQLGEQLGGPIGVMIIQDMPTLKRLTITDATKMTDANLKPLAGMKQLDHLELGSLDITPERVAALKPFAFLKSMRLVRGGKPYSPELRAQIQEALPKVKIAFE